MSYSKSKKSFRGKSNTSDFSKDLAGFIITTWILVISVMFPLVVNKAYFDILQTKFRFFSIASGIMIVLILLNFLLSKSFGKMLEAIDEKGFLAWCKQEFDIVDRCMLVFWGMAGISTLLAYPYIKFAFWGNMGRYTGFLLHSIYVMAYFCVSRNIRFRKYLFLAFTFVGTLVCLFGITDYFRMNLLGFEDRMNPDQIGMFASTIGNINTFTTYVGFVVAFSGAMFVMSRVREENLSSYAKYTDKNNEVGESKWVLVFYYISMIIGFFALTLGKSDNAYLTLLAFFGFLPFIAFRTKYGIRRYVLTLATYLSVIKVIDIINKTYTKEVSGIDGFFNIIINFLFLEVVILALWVIVGFLYFPVFRKNLVVQAQQGTDRTGSDEAPKGFLMGWTMFFGVVFFTVIVLLVYANTRSYEELEPLGDLRYYLHFQDTWGTFRGYIWRVSVEEYGKMDFLKKLFGSGPDTFGIYMISRRGNDMIKTAGVKYDSAHNEYLHYLVTIGPIALLAYLGVLIQTVKKGLGKFNDLNLSPYMAASAFLVICYAIQATVNINLPISTPVMWMFLMIIAGVTREDRKNAPS